MARSAQIPMHIVDFISFEDEAPDIVVSFALAPQAANSITLLRTPDYEPLLPDNECGVVVAAGVHGTAERELLVSITINKAGAAASIVSSETTYTLSLVRVPPQDIDAAVELLQRMNFDCRFVLNAA